MFRTKSVEAIRADHEAHVRGDHGHGPALKRELGLFSLVALGVGCTIGSGIFVMPAEIASQTGPAMVVSFILAAVACALAALSYCELANLIPASGSAYSYTYVALGEVVAWMIGWALLLEYGLANSAVASGWGSYLNQILGGFGWHIPPRLLFPPGVHIPNSTEVGLFNAPAAFSIVLITLLLIAGIKESARVNNVLVAAKCLALMMFIGLCMGKFEPSRMEPFMPFGWKSVAASAGQLFFLFVGFDAVSTVAEEAVDAQRDMPRGIVIALAIVSVLYVAVGLVLTGLYPLAQLKGLQEPLAAGLIVAGYPKAAYVLSIVAVIGILGVLIVGSIGQTRILYVMSRDGLAPAFMSKISPRTGTPVASTLVLGVVTAILAASVPLDALWDMVSFGTLAAFCAVSAGVIAMRRKAPDIPRVFKCPGVPFVPILSIAVNVALMLTLQWSSWFTFLGWMAVGLVVYFLWGHKSASKVFNLTQAEPGPLLP
ncbi:MAG: spore germination family protein [Cyanobacteria bacterium RYN_339]|nr:spore germination family protein [Cyanobacteria bacterium RYN_339]